ncbi:MAG: tail fiber domain-containing protein, partial [Mangrovimonas sp.]|nr:tail fiber domain-containing protein [Mangrovimonas sp.]
LFNATNGLGNVAIGFSSLYSLTSGSYNVAIGSNAYYNNLVSDDNVVIGGNAGYSNVTGERSVYLGASTGYNNINGDDNIFIGYNAGYNETGSNKLYIENSNANANNALIYGEFDNDLLRVNGDLEINSGNVNADTGTLFVDALNNRVGVNTTNPDFPFSVNGSANLNEGVGGAATALRVNGFEALWFNSTYFSWGFGGTSNFFADPVGIGAALPAYQLQLNTNSAAKPTSSAWTVASDARLKTNVHEFTDGLNLIDKINPVWFTYNGKAGMPHETGVGTIAQELQKVAPYMVNEWTYQSEDGKTKEDYLGVDYGALDFVLINAIKEQQKIIEQQKERITALERRLDNLERTNN